VDICKLELFLTAIGVCELGFEMKNSMASKENEALNLMKYTEDSV